jgi:hypothetical protein
VIRIAPFFADVFFIARLGPSRLCPISPGFLPKLLSAKCCERRDKGEHGNG